MEVTNNKRKFHFEVTLAGGEVAYLEYRWLKAQMVLMHTVVPVAFRGTGTGSALVKYVLDYASTNNLKIIVYCPFVEKYMKAHPEYEVLRSTDN